MTLKENNDSQLVDFQRCPRFRGFYEWFLSVLTILGVIFQSYLSCVVGSGDVWHTMTLSQWFQPIFGMKMSAYIENLGHTLPDQSQFLEWEFGIHIFFTSLLPTFQSFPLFFLGGRGLKISKKAHSFLFFFLIFVQKLQSRIWIGGFQKVPSRQPLGSLRLLGIPFQTKKIHLPRFFKKGAFLGVFF